MSGKPRERPQHAPVRPELSTRHGDTISPNLLARDRSGTRTANPAPVAASDGLYFRPEMSQHGHVIGPLIGRGLLLLLTMAMGLHATPALGQDQDVRKMKLQAQEDCLSNKTDSGVAILARLYALTGQPNYIYNQGRCYEQAARPDDAINKFREYLRVAKNTSAAERADAEKHIAECRTLKAEQERERRAAAVAQPAATTPPLKLTPAPLETNEPAPAAIVLTAEPKAESSPLYAKWWFWTGIAAVVGGAVTVYLLATRSTIQSACAIETYPCATLK